MIPRLEEIELMNGVIEAAKKLDDYDHSTVIVLRTRLERLRLYRLRRAQRLDVG